MTRTKRTLLFLMIVALLTAAPRPGAAPRTTLDFYFIDVEGGQSTLIVTPAGESLLVDTGYATSDHRDAARIAAAAREAGLARIDYLLITHFHPDHDAGVVELSRRIPIRTFFDHGDLPRTPEFLADARAPGYRSAYRAYVAVRAKGRHVEPRVGDPLPLKGIDARWVASALRTLFSDVSTTLIQSSVAIDGR